MTKQLAAALAFGYLKYYVPLVAVIGLPALVVIHDPHAWYVGLVALSFAATGSLFMFAYELARRRECETLQSFGVAFVPFAVPVALVSLGPLLLCAILATAIARDPARAAAYAVAVLLGTSGATAIVLIRGWKHPGGGVASSIVLASAVWGFAIALAIYVIER